MIAQVSKTLQNLTRIVFFETENLAVVAGQSSACLRGPVGARSGPLPALIGTLKFKYVRVRPSPRRPRAVPRTSRGIRPSATGELHQS